MPNNPNRNDKLATKARQMFVGFNWWLAFVLLIVTGAVIAVLWQLVESLEGSSVQVHKYIDKSKEDEHDIHQTFSQATPDQMPSMSMYRNSASPFQAILCFQNGVKSMAQGQDDLAIKQLKEAIDYCQQQPDGATFLIKSQAISGPKFQADVNICLSTCYSHQKNDAAALRCLNEAIRLNPIPGYYQTRAAVYKRLHQPSLAEQDRQSGLKLEAENGRNK
jgi:tetratricopeptide (TPR) repeat protein